MGDIVLPTAKSELARIVSDAKIISKLERFISPGVNVQQFLGSVVAEANTLRDQISDKEMQDQRTQKTFLIAAFNAAVVGLIPGSALGHCWFVPFKKNKAKVPYYVVTYVPGYRGFLELAFTNGFLVQCSPEVVLANESVMRGHTENGPWIKHDIPIPRDKPDRSNVIGAYCSYRTIGGGQDFVFVERSEIDAVDTQRNIWASNYVAQCLKTPIRRASKRWRLTRQLAAAVMLDEQVEHQDGSQDALADFQIGNGANGPVKLDDFTEGNDSDDSNE